jgi:hypothetical protein
VTALLSFCAALAGFSCSERNFPMRFLHAFVILAVLCQSSRGEEDKPLAGLDGVQFSASVMTMADIPISKDRIGRVAEDALQKASILRKGEKAADYPLLALTIHGGIRQGVVFFVWELQVKEKVAIPANKTYRRAAFQGPAIVWQTSGMMSTDPANMELALMAQIKKTMAAFIETWREANPANSPADKDEKAGK